MPALEIVTLSWLVLPTSSVAGVAVVETWICVFEAERASFGVLLRCYRVAAGLSQEALAERARLSAAAVGAYERGLRQAHEKTFSAPGVTLTDT